MKKDFLLDCLSAVSIILLLALAQTFIAEDEPAANSHTTVKNKLLADKANINEQDRGQNK